MRLTIYDGALLFEFIEPAQSVYIEKRLSLFLARLVVLHILLTDNLVEGK